MASERREARSFSKGEKEDTGWGERCSGGSIQNSLVMRRTQEKGSQKDF